MIRLLLVDDREIVYQGLRALLNLESDLEVVGVADNGRVAIQQVEALQPDVVLMDIKMSIMDGIEATRIISQQFPDTKVLVVSTFDEDDYISHSIKAGAKGYLLKNMPVEELVQSIRLVYRGYSLMGPGLMERMPDSMVSNKSDTKTEKPELAELTKSESAPSLKGGVLLTPKEIDFTWKTALQAANILMFLYTGKYLSDLETIVLHGAWNNYTYEQIAEAKGYTTSYLCRDIGCKLWENLSIALKVRVSKTNFKAALKREWQKYTQAILSQSRNQLAKLLTTENITLFEGLLALSSTVYLERSPIENICYETIGQPGSLIRIEGAKWMGKTSLVERILEQGNLHAQRTVYLDFSTVERKIIQDIDALLRWLCIIISFQLNLEDIQDYYQKSVLNCNNNCTIYFEKYILNETQSDIVLALDNIDYLFFYKETTENFRKLLSDWHQKGQVKGLWSKLKLILTQSTNASISSNISRSLFSKGTSIVLKKFSFDQIKILANFYKLEWDDFTICRLLNEVGGNPYLVRLAMYQASIKNIALKH